MGVSARSRRNIQRTNCRWIQTLQRYCLRSNASQTGPTCCSQVPPPGVLTMLLRIQQDYIRRAGWCLVACPSCGASPGTACTEGDQKRGKRYAIPVHDERRQLATQNGFGSVGWHTFRHTYRTLLSGADTPIDVQQKLLRHAQISTTMRWRSADGEPKAGEQQGREKPTVT
jgi:hypothetical protein